MKIMQIHNSSLRDRKLKDVPLSIPMELLNEEMAQTIHGQSLNRLNERGGLGVCEILANIKKDKSIYRQEETQQKVDELNAIIFKNWIL